MRKGITPIVSVVLLLLITIALAGGVLVYITGLVGGLQQDFLLKSTSCQRIDAQNVTFRGYISNTLDSPILANAITVSLVSGPTAVADVTLADDDIPTESIDAGQQRLFSITATHATAMESGTYRVEFASQRSVDSAIFNCP